MDSFAQQLVNMVTMTPAQNKAAYKQAVLSDPRNTMKLPPRRETLMKGVDLSAVPSARYSISALASQNLAKPPVPGAPARPASAQPAGLPSQQMDPAKLAGAIAQAVTKAMTSGVKNGQ